MKPSALFIAFVLVAIRGYSQATFQKLYSGLPDAYADPKAMYMTPDGNYIFSGLQANSDAFVAEINQFGDIIWNKEYGGGSYDHAFSISPTENGGWILTGQTRSFYDAFSQDIYILKIDSIGTLEWSRVFADYQFQSGSQAIQTSTGEYMIVGIQTNFDSDSSGIFLAKLSETGDSLWSEIINVGIDQMGVDIVELSDGGFVILADGADDFAALIKVNTDGNIYWAKGYGDWDGLAQQTGRLRNTADNGFIATGIIYENDTYDYLLLKMDSVGNLTWAKSYDYLSDNPTFVSITNDGGYLLVGCASTGGEGDCYVVKTDTAGVPDWSAVYDGIGYEVGIGGFQTNDDGCIIVSSSFDTISWVAQTLLIKTDSAGNSGCDFNYVESHVNSPHINTSILMTIVLPTNMVFLDPATVTTTGASMQTVCENLSIPISVENIPSLLLYPNPATDYFLLQLNEFPNAISRQLEIFDATGKIVLSQMVYTYQSTISIHLQPGIYLVRVQNEEDVVTNKLIVK